MKNLTLKQFAFIENYLITMSISEASQNVYGNPQMGYQVIKNRDVMKRIRQRLKEKQATLDRIYEKSLSNLEDILDSGQTHEKLSAAKVVTDIKLKSSEIEKKTTPEPIKDPGSNPIVINIQEVKKEING